MYSVALSVILPSLTAGQIKTNSFYWLMDNSVSVGWLGRQLSISSSTEYTTDKTFVDTMFLRFSGLWKGKKIVYNLACICVSSSKRFSFHNGVYPIASRIAQCCKIPISIIKSMFTRAISIIIVIICTVLRTKRID